MIVRSSPETGLDAADQAWFESDADGNDAAIREIDAEATRHGLVRVREYWLLTGRLTDGRIVRRGFCYRPMESDLARRVAARRGTDLTGTPAVETIRAMRDTGDR